VFIRLLFLGRFGGFFGFFGLRFFSFLGWTAARLAWTAATAAGFAEGFAQNSEESFSSLLFVFHFASVFLRDGFVFTVTSNLTVFLLCPSFQFPF
jgi:hypothetical protein